MEFYQFIKNKRQTLAAFFVFFLVVGSVFTFLQPFKYSARSKLLVIQENAGGVDPFAVSRSVEYLSNLFSQVVYSSSFFNLVTTSQFNIDKNYFVGDSINQIKIWKKTVSAKNVEGTGIINVVVYHPNSYQAKQIALAVNNALISQNSNYQGIGNSVKITVIDEPLVSNYPDQPNLLVNLGIIVALSIVFGFIYIYIFPEEKYNVHLFDSGSKKKKIKQINSNQTRSPQHHNHEYEQPQNLPYEDTEKKPNIYSGGNIKNILK
jgi:capsular polysaccharide biosynthesis protein